MSTISSFKSIENKHDVYRQKDCMKKFCKFLRAHNENDSTKKSAAHKICNLKYIVPKKSPIVFHNRYNYDYHYIIKELAEEF